MKSGFGTTHLRTLVSALLIVAAVAIAWSNSWSVPFLLDDHDAVLGNASLRESGVVNWLMPDATRGETVSGRPILNLSFALNHAAGGFDVRHYHATNLFIHAAAALVLFGIVRRTAARRGMAAGGTGMALAVALLWAVHPLQTAAVTYIAQRAESLAGLFALLALYGFIRGAGDDAPPATTPRVAWTVVSWGACLLAMATKETAAAIPVLVLLYDRTFVSGSWREAWRRHRVQHLGFALTWLLLLGLVWQSGGRGGSAGFDAEIGPGAYLLTQYDALVRYLGLVVWPVGQVFDYGALTVSGWSAVWLQAIVLSGVLVASVWALWRNRVSGFLGAAFFLLLAPSSSVVPVATQTMAEHRMYLALAPVVILVGLASRPLWGGRRVAAGAIVAAIASAWVVLTWTRNDVYRSEVEIWSDTVEKRPANPRAHYNLGLALAAAGRTEEAQAEFHATLERQPNHAFARFQLGTHALVQRRWREAVQHLEAAVAAAPELADAHVNLGRAYEQQARDADAAEHYRRALALEPEAVDVRVRLGAVLTREGRMEEAGAWLREALAAEPGSVDAHYQMGLWRERTGDGAGAARAFAEAVRLNPAFAAGYLALGNVLARSGETSSATAAYEQALRNDPALAEAHYALGNVWAKTRRLDDAVAAYRRALQIDPEHLPARNNLANALLMLRRLPEAVREYEEVLRRDPGNTAVRENLQRVRDVQGRGR